MKVLWGQYQVDGRGKVGGTVNSKNRYGAFSRNKVSPVNAQTSFQMNIRQRLAQLATMWGSLTPAERNSWLTGNANYPRTDVFGNTIILSGSALFNALNSNLYNLGLPAIRTCPPPVAFGTISFVSGTAVAATGIITLVVNNTVITTLSYVIAATKAGSAGINYMKGKFRQIDIKTTAVGPYVETTPYANKFGAFTAGQKIGFMMYGISTLTGQATVPVYINIIAS